MSTQIKSLKFIFAGGITAAFEFVSYTVLLVLGLSPVIANGLSFMLALVLSFIINYRWVFRSNALVKSTFVKYLFLAIVNLILGSVIINVLVYDIYIDEFIAKIIVMGMIALWNYIIYSKFLFIENKKKAEIYGSE